MSEAERQKLLSVLLGDQSEDKNRKLLSLVLTNISEAKIRELLEQLKNWHKSKLTEMREHPRKTSLIPVECSSSDGVCFTDFIQDISDGGVLIQTNGNFFAGQQITLTFSHPKAEKDITVRGEVVRVDSEGIGVKFNEPLTAL
jgi:tRNA U34 2-thiouridine synthase MnmA/TrmU